MIRYSQTEHKSFHVKQDLFTSIIRIANFIVKLSNLNKLTNFCEGSYFSKVMEKQFTTKVHVNQHNPKYQMRNVISTTKYHWYSFIPLFLLEQYMKFSNIFYLLNACLTFIPGAAVVNPSTTFLPVAAVLAVALIRELIEDIGRYRSDRLSNNQTYQIVRDGQLQTVKSCDLYQGDILIIKNKQEVPADSLLLLSSDESRQANINTASLDGESNLKQRNAVLT